MKKFLTLALALVLALSVAVPAMAFTGVAYEGDETVSDQFELAIKLVDVEQGYVNVNFLAPATDRGYLKNEMVCAVVGLWVKKKAELGDYFTKLTFSGTNVSLWQDENFRGDRVYSRGLSPTPDGGGWGMLQYLSKNAYQKLNAPTAGMPFYYAAKMSVSNAIVLPNVYSDGGTSYSPNYLDLLYDADGAQTYYFAIFARVIADGATINAKLSGGNTLVNAVLTSLNAAGATNPFDDISDARVDMILAGLLEDEWLYLTYSDAFDDNNDGFIVEYNWVHFNDDYDVALYDATGSLPGNDLVGDNEIGYYVRYCGGATRANDYTFLIVTNSKGVCKAMYVFDPAYMVGGVMEDSLLAGCAFAVTVTNTGKYVFTPTTGIDVPFYGFTGKVPETRTGLYPALVALVEDVIVGDFELDPGYENGVMKKAWWEDAMGNTLFVEVAIEPWYAEITVPPEIVVDPPKTGDAMNILGFVMIALAGLAVVAIRKVRA